MKPNQFKIGDRVRLKAIWPGAEAVVECGDSTEEVEIRFEREYVLRDASPQDHMRAAMATRVFHAKSGAPMEACVYADELELLPEIQSP